jgi:ABC-type Na+ transport system ATPase subunit NatA
VAPIITVEHLTKRYRKSAGLAVDDISFDVQPGELFAFLGPNGVHFSPHATDVNIVDICLKGSA